MAIVSSARAGVRAAPRATVIQLRAPGLTIAALEREARALIGAVSVPVLVSSRCDVAVACGAAGVNLPEKDISVADARILLDDRLVGQSVHSLESALRAQAQDADAGEDGDHQQERQEDLGGQPHGLSSALYRLAADANTAAGSAGVTSATPNRLLRFAVSIK